MRGRRTEAQLRADALDVLLDALGTAGFQLHREPGGADQPDPGLSGSFDGRPFRLRVEHTAYCTAARAHELVDRPERPLVDNAIPIVVADRVTADARHFLSERGWSWLDTGAGQLSLRAPGIRVIDSVERAVAATANAPRRSTISAGAGITVAYWLCSHPGRALRPTNDAEHLRIALSTISTAVGQLAAAGLVDDAGHGQFPELFWELAERWRPHRQWLAAVPEPPTAAGDRQWRRVGTAAAAALGAPVAAGSDQPVELYVPGPAVLNTTARRYGVVPAGTGPACVAVAPTSVLLSEAAHRDVLDGWPLAPIVSVALDLAGDAGRGREILQDWEHPDAVWR